MNQGRLQTFTHQSPIGHWSVSVWRTDPRLSEMVASMWFGEGKTAYQRDRILPSGQSQLLINLGPPQYRIEQARPKYAYPSWTYGIPACTRGRSTPRRRTATRC